MKYAAIFNILAGIFTVYLFYVLGYEYETIGYGLHPALAGLGVLFGIAVSGVSAWVLNEDIKLG